MIEEQNFPYRTFRAIGNLLLGVFWGLLILVIIYNVPAVLDDIWSLLGL